ncbi:MAG: ABC transporter substrate-binding protein [Gemmatimonadales bacterium]|nr:ABC transporter substrate-binding protein [Gemmatimonadales bacterium]
MGSELSVFPAARRCMLGLAFLGLATALPAHAENGVTADTIKVGTTNALTGPIAVCGAVSAGANAYIEKINKAGGVNGRTIEYTVLDDAYSTQRAIGNVRRLLGQEKVFALFSGCGTATGAAVLSAIERDTVPYLFPFVGLDSLTQPTKSNVFSVLPLYGAQLATIIDYVVRNREIRTAAMSMITIAGHEAWTETVRAKLKEVGVELIDEQFVEVTAADKAPYVTQMKSKNPDLVVLVDSSPGAARYLIEMQRQGWKPKAITGISTLSDESFLRAAGEVGEGIVIAPAIVLPPTDPRSKECVDAMVASNRSIEPSAYTMFGCLGAKVFVDALERTGKNPTRAGLIAELEKMQNFESGISGTVSFSADKHQGLESVYPVGIKDGAFLTLGEPLPLQ